MKQSLEISSVIDKHIGAATMLVKECGNNLEQDLAGIRLSTLLNLKKELVQKRLFETED